MIAWMRCSADTVENLGVELSRVPDLRHWRREERSPNPPVFVGQAAGDAAEPVWLKLWGRKGLDCLHSALLPSGASLRGPYRLWPPPAWGSRCMTWAVPADRIMEFERSRRRSSWCRAIQLKKAPWLKSYLPTLVDHEQPEDPWEGVHLKVPSRSPVPRGFYVCDGCGARGHAGDFAERSVPGLAGVAGLDCRSCDSRDVGAMVLVTGQPRGEVRIADEQPCLFWRP